VYPRRLLAFALAVLALAGAACAEEKTVTPNRLWEGEFADEKLKKEAPKGGVITDAKTFAKLWKAWRKDEKVPEVDFKKELAVVVMCGKGVRPSTYVTLKDGALWVNWEEARRGWGGWGYSIVTLDRKGVKKANGVELPKAKPRPEEPDK
jgi:hypothetical protein